MGDAVRVRRQPWRLVDARSYERSVLVSLIGIGAANHGAQRQVLWPFDELAPLARARHPRHVAWRTWRRAWRALLIDEGSPAMLRAASQARIDLLPYQLEPVLAVVSGLASRILIADEVGLGKTIQAGLAAAELIARGAADRVLVLTPAGVRDQWVSELKGRFGLEPVLVNASFLRRTAATLPPGINPWSTLRVAVASLDYVKRPEVLPAVRSSRWDMLIIDEAHGVSTGSDRHHAISRLAAEAAYVLLLTATPHSGDAEAFAALCRLGALQDQVLAFRRTRRDLGGLVPPRRVHHLIVRPTPAEQRMHALLSRLTRAARSEHGDGDRGVWLALTVLHKRALSSAHSLERTVRRQLAQLGGASSTSASQLPLPLDTAGERDEADEAPSIGWPLLGDPNREARLLRAVAEAAQIAAKRESKLVRLGRWLRRLRSRREAAIVFTEYRDTLLHLRDALGLDCAVLHGGLSPVERRAAINAFTMRRVPLLLATDAAGEGLNLHHGCRIVFNLELPWNPMRLEQRAGRVDRIGQRHTTHVFQLIAGGTGERRILDRLASKVARARLDLGPLGASDTEDALAHLAIEGSGPPSTPAGGVRPPTDHLYATRRLTDEATAVWGDLLRNRAVTTCRRWRPAVPPDCPFYAFGRRRSIRLQLNGRRLVILRTTIEDQAGRCLASKLTGAFVQMHQSVDRRRFRTSIGRFIDEVRTLVAGHPSIDAWIARSRAMHQAFWTLRLQREQAIADASIVVPDQLQPGLFDRRLERQHEAARAATRAGEEDAKRRVAIARQALVATATTTVVLAVIP